MTVTTFEIQVAATGRPGKIIVGGVDLSDQAAAVTLHARPGEVTRLAVELFSEGTVEGLADVTLISPSVGLARFFGDLDADEVEKEALGRLGSFDDRTVTQAILDVLADLALGRS
jgi:hypothetical protein